MGNKDTGLGGSGLVGMHLHLDQTCSPISYNYHAPKIAFGMLDLLDGWESLDFGDLSCSGHGGLV